MDVAREKVRFWEEQLRVARTYPASSEEIREQVIETIWPRLRKWRWHLANLEAMQGPARKILGTP